MVREIGEATVARRVLRLLLQRPDTAICFACLARDLDVERRILERFAIGLASTLSNVTVGRARCSACGTITSTVSFR